MQPQCSLFLSFKMGTAPCMETIFMEGYLRPEVSVGLKPDLEKF